MPETRLLTMVTSLLLISCHPLFCNWDFGYSQLTSQPPDDRVIGNYKLTKSSIDFLMDRGFREADYQLKLMDGGQFQFINGPSLIFDKTGQTKQGLQNKKGKWFIICADDCLIELENVCVVPLSEKDGELAILITIGDGDECNGLIYEKQD